MQMMPRDQTNGTQADVNMEIHVTAAVFDVVKIRMTFFLSFSANCKDIYGWALKVYNF